MLTGRGPSSIRPTRTRRPPTLIRPRSGSCGNLSAAVGPFAISTGLIGAPPDGTATVRIWQANIGKKIMSRVPMSGGEVNRWKVSKILMSRSARRLMEGWVRVPKA